MRMPTIHLLTEAGKAACGNKKGVGYNLKDFKKEVDEDSFLSLAALCEKCKKSQLLKPSSLTNKKQ